MSKIKYRYIHILIVFYIIAAFTWWAILLYQRTLEIHELQLVLANFVEDMDPEEITKEFLKQKRMIMGEGLVFGLSILVSMILMSKAFLSEINVNRKLNNFLLSVTHELKTPIASLKLILQTLYKKDLEMSKCKDLIETAHEESTRLESLVNNILTVAQMDQSYNYNFEMIRLDNILNERVTRFRTAYSERKIITEINSNVEIKADRESMIKLIDNLIDNAIKYSPSEKPVRIFLQTIANQVILSIADQGPGIEESEKDNILEKFYRIGNEETRKTSGTGLGLFIINEIVNAHKGHLRIKDNHPEGSIFEIEFLKSS
ncbi:MAG: HAMP domain-containing histidine kinase [Bacteroidia bacterium]|nr:HAMP domain-containing histidine kinase [Bacteroidia bacterium]